MKYSTQVVLEMTDVIGEYIVVEKDSHEFSGAADLACGPTNEEKGLQASSDSFSKTLQGAYNTLFSQQQGTLTQLNSRLNQIGAGTTGPGFGASELQARTSQIVNQAGANARNLEQAEANQSAGQTFAGQQDSSGLARSSAIRQQLTGEAESAAETQKSNALENLSAENYATGRNNAITMAGGLETLAGIENPTPYAGAAINENQASFGQAKDIQQQQAQEDAAIAGGITSAAMDAATFGAGALAGNQGFDLQGGLSALSGG